MIETELSQGNSIYILNVKSDIQTCYASEALLAPIVEAIIHTIKITLDFVVRCVFCQNNVKLH